MAVVLAAAAAVGAKADGAAVFDANCAFCHQAGGVGVPGQFPRLAGRLGVIAAKPQGKAFLFEVLLNGMSGHVTVDGDDILGIMPGFDALPDDDIASVLRYLSGLDHAPVPFSADTAKAARALPRMAPGDVAAKRARLVAAKVVP